MEEQDVQTSKNRSMQSDALLHIIIINFYFAHLIYSYEYLNSKYLLNLIQNYNLVHIQYSTNLKGKSGAPKSKPKKTVEKTITFIWSQFWGCISSRCLYYKQLQGISKQGYADPPFSFSPIIMKDAKCVESNEKSIFRFLFFEFSWKMHRKLGYKNDHNAINKNLKFNVSFDSADSASFMWIWTLLIK